MNGINKWKDICGIIELKGHMRVCEKNLAMECDRRKIQCV